MVAVLRRGDDETAYAVSVSPSLLGACWKGCVIVKEFVLTHPSSSVTNTSQLDWQNEQMCRPLFLRCNENVEVVAPALLQQPRDQETTQRSDAKRKCSRCYQRSYYKLIQPRAAAGQAAEFREVFSSTLLVASVVAAWVPSVFGKTRHRCARCDHVTITIRDNYFLPSPGVFSPFFFTPLVHERDTRVAMSRNWCDKPINTTGLQTQQVDNLGQEVVLDHHSEGVLSMVFGGKSQSNLSSL